MTESEREDVEQRKKEEKKKNGVKAETRFCAGARKCGVRKQTMLTAAHRKPSKSQLHVGK